MALPAQALAAGMGLAQGPVAGMAKALAMAAVRVRATTQVSVSTSSCGLVTCMTGFFSAVICMLVMRMPMCVSARVAGALGMGRSGDCFLCECKCNT